MNQNTHWEFVADPPVEKIQALAQALNINPWLAKLLVQRGVDSFDVAKDFFRPQKDHLHDPFAMKDMDKAVRRLHSALQNKEKILLFGDYDVDGTTAVSLVYLFLKPLHPEIFTYVPDRYLEGYGISTQGIDFAYNNGCTLIIALDCGIKASEKVSYAKHLGLDFIICDHHNPGETLPDAVAVLDPKRLDCRYPYKELSGCGVGFKLLQAYCLQYAHPIHRLWDLIDLLVVSIAADIVPITGENRVLAYFGLQKINTNPLPGLQCLINISGLTKPIHISQIVFGLAPRINAAGRIAHARAAVDLLTATDLAQAHPYGKLLQDQNATRKDLDAKILQQALELIKNTPGYSQRKTTVLFNPTWHKGVLGIVASKCLEHYYRPTVILCQSGNYAVGSARSVPGFDLYEAIQSCSEYLHQYGGHTHAAGLTLEIEQIDAFANKFEEVVAETITAGQLTPKIFIDTEWPLKLINRKTYAILKQMSPFGPGNMTPVFISYAVRDTGKSRIVGEKHLKLSITQGIGPESYDAIGYDLAHFLPLVKEHTFDICYTIEENTYQGVSTIQLVIKDIRKHNGLLADSAVPAYN